MRFLRTMVLRVALPTLVSGVTPRAVARQVVRESGNSTLARAWPALSVTRSVAQKAVSGKALRILGCTRRSGLSCARRDGRAQLGQPHAALAGFAVEEKVERIFGVDAVPFAAEEERQRIVRRCRGGWRRWLRPPRPG